ncbi:hypothetical protein PsorP6_006089 [Peronosclerospora sorghi]|uniref:Uncharacterized protein n=1 Tax=Peronosclerospora sorghi TaxID=230839 RepID=A0ACC0W0Z0_9STRA|nr:hypothetical protein PsorP6_006089 [Peronosclerospora sorghi]
MIISRRLSLLTAALGATSTVAVEVSVCRDATYNLSVEPTALCSGAGSKPAGWRCPKADDVAVADCLSTLASFESGRCVAPEDAVCQVVEKDTWGCVLPSVGCNIEAKVACETWDFNGDDRVKSLGSFGSDKDYNETWFVKTTKLREIVDCENAATPAPSSPAPEMTDEETTEMPTHTKTPEAHQTEAANATETGRKTEPPLVDAKSNMTDTATLKPPSPPTSVDRKTNVTETESLLSQPTKTNVTGEATEAPPSPPASFDPKTNTIDPETEIPPPTVDTETNTTDLETEIPPTSVGTETNGTDAQSGVPPALVPTPVQSPMTEVTAQNGSSGYVQHDTESEGTVGNDDSSSKHSASVKFAAAASPGGLSDKSLAIVATAVACVAVVLVAVVAVAFAKRRLVKNNVDTAEKAEDIEDKQEDNDEDSENESAPLAPPTPAIVTGECAVTPTVYGGAKLKVKKTPVTTGAATSTGEVVTNDTHREVELNDDPNLASEAVAGTDA